MMKRLYKVKLYFSPFFLGKFYLQRSIKNAVDKYDFRGSIMDFGCGEMPYKYLFNETDKYKGIDMKTYSSNKDFNREKPDYYFDSNYLKDLTLPFSDNSFDNVVSFQVLEHHSDPNKMISELARITNKGGYFLLTAPFMGGVHEEPRDYQRFTHYGLRILLEKYEWEVLNITSQGSIFSTLSNLVNEYINNVAMKGKYWYAVVLFIYLPFLAFSYLSLLLDLIFHSKKIVLGYTVVARKRI